VRSAEKAGKTIRKAAGDAGKKGEQEGRVKFLTMRRLTTTALPSFMTPVAKVTQAFNRGPLPAS